MLETYRKFVWVGVGAVALGLTAWGASQSGLTSQLLTQANNPASTIGACYYGRGGYGYTACQQGSLGDCTQKIGFDNFFAKRQVRDSIWVGGGTCDPQYVRYVSARGQSIASDARDGQETAREQCKQHLAGGLTIFECPYGIEKYVVEPTVIADEVWTAWEAFVELGNNYVTPQGQPAPAVYRSKCGAVIQCNKYPLSQGQSEPNVPAPVPEPPVAPTPSINPTPTPIVRAQSRWCPERSTEEYDWFWGAYCCREYPISSIGSGTCEDGLSGLQTPAHCQSRLPSLTKSVTSFGFSTSFFGCAEGAKKDAIARAQGTVDAVKAKCPPPGKTTVDYDVIEETREGMFLACRAQVASTVTCDYTPECN